MHSVYHLVANYIFKIFILEYTLYVYEQLLIMLQVRKKPVDVARAGGHGKVVALLEKDSPGLNVQVTWHTYIRFCMSFGHNC